MGRVHVRHHERPPSPSKTRADEPFPGVYSRIAARLLALAAVSTGSTRPAIDWLAPIVADAEAGFGGPLNAYELMSSMIEAGAAGVHWEDQLASEKKCGHMGGKVLIPTAQHIRTLNAARLAADVAGVPTIIVARTDSLGAGLTKQIDKLPQVQGAEQVQAGRDTVSLLQGAEKEAHKQGDNYIASEMFLLALADSKSDIGGIVTRAITIARAADQTAKDPWLLPTYFRIAKNRPDGSRCQFVALVNFDIRSNSYSKTYKIGRLVKGDTEFEPLPPRQIPAWAIEHADLSPMPSAKRSGRQGAEDDA